MSSNKIMNIAHPVRLAADFYMLQWAQNWISLKLILN